MKTKVVDWLASEPKRRIKPTKEVSSEEERLLVEAHATIQQHIATNLCRDYGLQRLCDKLLERLTNLREKEVPK